MNSKPSALSAIPPGGRVTVIRLRSLGDCVLTTPALQLLREHRPDLRIDVVVEPRFRQILEDHPAIDQLLDPDWRAIRASRPDLCLNLHGGSRSWWLTQLSGAKRTAGFAHFRQAWTYGIRIPRAQEILPGGEREVHTAEHLASAMFYLGVTPREIPAASLVAPPPASGLAIPAGPFAVLHPFASRADKSWPMERFVATATALRDRGLPVLAIGSAEDDTRPLQNFEVRQGLCLRDIKTLLSRAALFVGNDSGPGHLAAALGIPVVVLFGPSDYATWHPWKARGEALRAPGGDLGRLSLEDVLTVVARHAPSL